MDGDTGAALASVEVALYALSAEGVPGLRRSTTDASGAFAFEKIARSSNLAYLVGARYQNIPYPGARVIFQPGETEREVEIQVSGLSDSAAELVPTVAELRLQRTPGGARAVQTLRVENPGTKTFYVEKEARATSTPALRARLPEGATGFEMPLGVVPEGVEQRGPELLWWGPVHPGTQDLSFSYQVHSGDNEQLVTDWQLPSGASQTRLWVPNGGTLESPNFDAAEIPQGAVVGLAAFDGPAAERGKRFDISVKLPAASLIQGGATPTEIRALITADDAALAITETHTLQIPGTQRALGTHEDPLYRIPLPEDVTRLRFGSSGPSLTLLPDAEGGLIVLGEADPGELRVEIAYRLTTKGFPASYERRFEQRVPLLSILLADNGLMLPISDRLHRRRPARTPDGTFMHFEAFEVAADETVELTIDRRPSRIHAPDWLQRSTVALAGGLVVALLVAPLWVGARDEPTRQAEETAAERERLGVLAALRDLEHDHETGKVEEKDYEGIRTELRDRALTLMREARGTRVPAAPAGEAAPAEVAPAVDVAVFCTQCGTALEPSHRFCAQCGTERAETPAEPA